jgi:hypothetical protein
MHLVQSVFEQCTFADTAREMNAKKAADMFSDKVPYARACTLVSVSY